MDLWGGDEEGSRLWAGSARLISWHHVGGLLWYYSVKRKLTERSSALYPIRRPGPLPAAPVRGRATKYISREICRSEAGSRNWRECERLLSTAARVCDNALPVDPTGKRHEVQNAAPTAGRDHGCVASASSLQRILGPRGFFRGTTPDPEGQVYPGVLPRPPTHIGFVITVSIRSSDQGRSDERIASSHDAGLTTHDMQPEISAELERLQERPA